MQDFVQLCHGVFIEVAQAMWDDHEGLFADSLDIDLL